MFRGPARGLWFSPNPFSQTPDGTLKTADNVRFTDAGVIEPRRGFRTYGPGFGTVDSRADQLVSYGSSFLLAYDFSAVSLFTGISFNDFSAFYGPVGTNRLRFEGAARTMFFNPASGLQAWDGVGFGGEPVPAGCPQGLSATAANNSADGWQDADTAVAYRFTICRKDAFGRVIEGPPSGRVTIGNWTYTAVIGAISRAGTNVHGVFTNPQSPTGAPATPGDQDFAVGDVVILSPGEAGFPGGAKTLVDADGTGLDWTEAGAAVTNTVAQTVGATRSVDLRLFLPGELTTQNFIRVYRSFMTARAVDTPSDELFQVYESPFLDASDISNGYIDVHDTAPESTLDNPLYTNANTGDGALAARNVAPAALDIVYWGNRMWFANTVGKQSLVLTVLGTGSPDGVQAGDTLRVVLGTMDVTLTAISPGVPSANQFIAYTAADPGLNIQRTAQGIVAAFNASADNTAMYAYYVSEEGGLPGSIRFESRLPGTSAAVFNLYSSRSTAWQPALPTFVSPGWEIVSDDNAHPAGLSYSLLGIPDAVPPANSLLINSDNDATLRIFPLHYRLLIFKTDGIYTCTNVLPFEVQKLSAYVLASPDSVCVLEDRVYALSTQGWITISDSGVEDVGDAIDTVYRALESPSVIDATAERTFGLTYRSEHQVMIWSPEQNDDGTFTDDNAQAFVYSTKAQGFTRYPFGVRCGVVDPNTNSMVVAPTDSNQLWIELKAMTDLDFTDLPAFLGPPSAVSGEAITFDAAIVATISVGDALRVSEAYYRVTAASGTTVTTDGATGWTTGSSITHYPAISTELVFNKFTGGTPADLKMMLQSSLLWRRQGVHDLVASFSSEIQTDPIEVASPTAGWGEFRWGHQAWGSPTRQLMRYEPLPTQVANCAQLEVGFSTSQALTKFEFLGVDVAKKKDSEMNRG